MAAINTIIEHLRTHGATSQHKLTRAANVNSGTVANAIASHRTNNKAPRIRVAGAETTPSTGRTSPVFELGDAPDAELPARYLQGVERRRQGLLRSRENERNEAAIRAQTVADIDNAMQRYVTSLARYRGNPFRTSIVMLGTR